MKKNKEEKTKNIEPNKKQKIESVESAKEKVKKTETSNDKENKKSKVPWRTLAVIAFLLIFILCTLVSIRVKYLNVRQVGENYTSVLVTDLKNTYTIAISVFLIVYLVIYINNKVIKKGLKKFFDEDNKPLPKLPNKSLALVGGILASIIVPNIIGKQYAMFINSTEFGGDPDPIFHLDIGYYMFKLPFIQSCLILLIWFFICLIVYTAIYYVLTLNTCLDGVSGETLKKNTFIKQLMFFATVIVIIFAVYIIYYSMGILTQNMMSISDTELTGAGATDATVKLWGYRILSVVIVFSILRLFKYIKKGNFKQGMISACIVPVYMVCLFLAMTYYQVIYVQNNQLDKEKEYIEYNIENTKKAYGIDIEQKNITSYNTISREEVTQNKELIENIPVISKDVILKMVSSHQDNSVYYSYRRTQLANYTINGKKQSIYITPREILNDDMSYNNRTLKYTHGYSAIINTASDRDHNGYAEYLLSDFSNSAGDLKITEPRIYFGMDTNSIIATNTEFGKEYDYPITATTYEENIYKGSAGLKLNFWDRFILGLANRNLKLAFSSYITEDTKIIANRNILERVKSVLPYLEYDDEPYLVITDAGKLVWVIDGYTTSGDYPYSQIINTENPDGEREKINYIRNSVKVLIDAYNGTTTFYITDKTDPIIMAYKNMYPELFVEDTIPEEISKHFTYPKYLYEVQSKMIATYHDISADSLYRSDDLWQITPIALGTTNSRNNSSAMEPTYTVCKTPDSEEEQFGLVLTYNRQSKQNIISYLVGTCENGVSKLSLYRFPAENNVVGIAQLNNQIEQDTTISAELEKLNTSGTKLTREIKIIPINNTLLYVEPVYQVMLNGEDEIPILRKVIVASGSTVAIGDNIEEALTNLFTDYAIDIDVLDMEDMSAIIDSIIKANSNLDESLESGDFEMVGKDLSKLKSLIKQLEVAREEEIAENKKLDISDETNTVTNSIFNSSNIVENN